MEILGGLLRTLPTIDGDSSNDPHPPFQGHYCFLKWEFYCKVSIIIPIKYLFFTLVLFKKQMTQSSLLVLEFILSCLRKKKKNLYPQFLPLLFNITSIPTEDSVHSCTCCLTLSQGANVCSAVALKTSVLTETAPGMSWTIQSTLRGSG